MRTTRLITISLEKKQYNIEDADMERLIMTSTIK